MYGFTNITNIDALKGGTHNGFDVGGILIQAVEAKSLCTVQSDV